MFLVLNYLFSKWFENVFSIFVSHDSKWFENVFSIFVSHDILRYFDYIVSQ